MTTELMQMLVLTFAQLKGGVGKTALLVQFAYWLRTLGLRVLVIDLDHQMNASQPFARGAASSHARMEAYGVEVLDFGAGDVLTGQHDAEEIAGAEGMLVVLPAVPSDLIRIAGASKDVARQVRETFKGVIEDLRSTGAFDIVCIDVNPSPDTRWMAALAASTHVVTPVDPSEECVAGVSEMYTNPLYGLGVIRRSLNPALSPCGLLLNRATPSSPEQAEIIARLDQGSGDNMIRDSEGRPVVVPETQMIKVAQGLGLPVWLLGSEQDGTGQSRSQARKVYTHSMKPAFQALAAKMGITEVAA